VVCANALEPAIANAPVNAQASRVLVISFFISPSKNGLVPLAAIGSASGLLPVLRCRRYIKLFDHGAIATTLPEDQSPDKSAGCAM
jgi:hypothetical protein